MGTSRHSGTHAAGRGPSTLARSGSWLLWVTLVASGGACSRNEKASPLALSLGLYDVSPPHCASTDAAPEYPSPAHKAALLAFEGLKSHTLEVKGLDAVETLSDDDCTVTIQRTVALNDKSSFSLSRKKVHVVVPEACTFTVAARGEILEIGKSLGAPFEDSDDGREDIPFEVTALDSSMRLTSRPIPEFTTLWAAYGCGQEDRLWISLDGPK